MARRYRLAGTTAGLIVGALFVPSVAGSAALLAQGGGTPAVLLLAGSATVLAVQTVVFGRRPRTVEVLPGGDGLRICALFRRWDLPGARVCTIQAQRQENLENFEPTGYVVVTLEVELPVGSRLRLPGRVRPVEPPRYLWLRLTRCREAAAPGIVRRLQLLGSGAVEGALRGRRAGVHVPDAVLPFEINFAGFWVLCFVLAGCVVIWIGGVVAGAELLAR